MEENTTAPQKPAKQLVDTGNLVYTYDLPSDEKNALRPKHDSSEEHDDSKFSGLLNNYADEDMQADEAYDVIERCKEQYRKQNNIAKYDDELRRENQEEKHQQFQQPKPTLKNAPEDPLSAYFIANKGKSIQSLENFNGPVEVQKLTEEIANDLEHPNEVPVKHTLRKFNVLAKLLRTMNAEQIEEATRKVDEHDEQMKHDKCRRVYTDALVAAGTGPCVNEIMTMIEQRRIEGETAAELIAALPKTIRHPTEEMQQRFFVSLC